MNKKVLDDFIGDYKLNRTEGISVITTENLLQLKSSGYSVENLFDYLSQRYQCLLHGSRTNILDDHLKPNIAGNVYCSNLAAIAIMRAIISNKRLTSPGLQYPSFIDKDHPLKVRIYGINNQTMGNNGFVYVINRREKFQNEPKGSWQYIINGRDIPIDAKFPIDKKDFTYPVFDVANNRRIQ